MGTGLSDSRLWGVDLDSTASSENPIKSDNSAIKDIPPQEATDNRAQEATGNKAQEATDNKATDNKAMDNKATEDTTPQGKAKATAQVKEVISGTTVGHPSVDNCGPGFGAHVSLCTSQSGWHC